MAREFNVDWSGAYVAYKQSGVRSIAEFHRNYLAEFVIDGDMPPTSSTYKQFRARRKKEARRLPPSVQSVPSIRRLGSRLQIAMLPEELARSVIPSVSTKAAVSARTMHIRLPNGAELAFETRDPEQFVRGLILNTSGVL